jgi:hypothetical protein
VASEEIDNQQKSIEDTQETLDFLNSKYTNDEPYSYLEGSVRYLLPDVRACVRPGPQGRGGLRVRARTSGQSQCNHFIRFGYWDPSRDGLQCGEALLLSLKQLEAAYLEKRGHDFEMAKTISLRQVAPTALAHVRESGTCTFHLPGVLFDIDFPGHYFRGVRSVAVTIPCVAGPYTGVNATLTLIDHSSRITATGATDANRYAQKPPDTNGPDSRFTGSKVPINSIAVSTGQNDAGVFELSFSSERYLPFEGAGPSHLGSLSCRDCSALLTMV